VFPIDPYFLQIQKEIFMSKMLILVGFVVLLLLPGCGGEKERNMNKDKGFPRQETPKVKNKDTSKTESK